MSRRTVSSDIFQAIADPTRRRILDLLSGGEQPVAELAKAGAAMPGAAGLPKPSALDDPASSSP